MTETELLEELLKPVIKHLKAHSIHTTPDGKESTYEVKYIQRVFAAFDHIKKGLIVASRSGDYNKN